MVRREVAKVVHSTWLKLSRSSVGTQTLPFGLECSPSAQDSSPVRECGVGGLA